MPSGIPRRGALALLAGAALSGCLLVIPHRYCRFKVTVEVQTPQGLRRGSSVMEIIVARRISVGTQSSARYTGGLTHAEAIVLDLPNGPLFVLLTIPNAGGDIDEAIYCSLGGPDLTNDGLMDFAEKMGARGAHYQADLPPELWPKMVRFGNVDVSTTVEPVDPREIGVRRISVETTRDPVTTGIRRRLKWLGGRHESGTSLEPNGKMTIHPDFAETIRQDDFVREYDR